MNSKPNRSNIRDYSRFTDVSIENGNLRRINQFIQNQHDELLKAVSDALCCETLDACHERLREAVHIMP